MEVNTVNITSSKSFSRRSFNCCIDAVPPASCIERKHKKELNKFQEGITSTQKTYRTDDGMYCLMISKTQAYLDFSIDIDNGTSQ